ncbi:adenosylcobinamide-GDP ribazoletransferase [Arsenicitalea aurantiaca]|uniref:adenosylcobinamide-GDP ribazoletransferase n=1 Tax=Arsenicitalea aurantiaca TaxID=1783274 RepID=UPI001315A164|nr:adenosylcobinamide-GDP ribazoletransferase [Arsenicitalea aurantiaca]
MDKLQSDAGGVPPEHRPGNDNAEPAPGIRLGDDVLMALRFFSRLPTGSRAHEKPDLGRMARALGFASLVIGLVPALSVFGLGLLGLPPFFAAAFAAGIAIIVTGAMGEDGLADAADGLFGGITPARRLEIMKDSRHGSYGVAAMVILLLLRVSALAALLTISPLAAALGWLSAMVLARSGALTLPLVLAPARADGAAATAGRLRIRDFAIGAVFSLIIGFILAAPVVGLLGLGLALALMGLACYGWIALCRRLVGGQTGDLTGALQSILEIAALSAFILSV